MAGIGIAPANFDRIGPVTVTIGLLLFWSAANTPGITLYQERRFAEAEKAFRAALKTNPQDERAQLYLGRTLIALQRLPEALAVLEPICSLKTNPEIRLEAGRLLRQLAERRFRNLQAVAGGAPATLEISGRRLEREGNFAAALEQLRAVQKLEPDRPGIHYEMGSVLWKIRDLPAAEQELRAELAQRQSHGMANFRLGQVLLTTEREAEAILYLERARAALPHLPEVPRELGKAYRKAGRMADARTVWEAVAAARPNDDQVHYLLGNLYRQLGETELARRELERHREILQVRRERP